MPSNITTQTNRQFIDHVSVQQHAMAGAVIANSAAQAVALGEACMRISLDPPPDSPDTPAPIEKMSDLKEQLITWCEQDAEAIAQFVALREAGKRLKGQQLLCQAPAEISRLAIQAGTMLQQFRPRVVEQVQDDLEMSLTLLAGAAQAAMLLLDSNLRIWPEEALLAQFEPVLADLERQIKALTPVNRLR